ncbi:MAG: 50S ribosomal protein L21 [Candidatus Aminicenantes bacterium]|nr:50S ribosomal protein L21 [Candidatus Aminicenantes bacterium]
MHAVILTGGKQYRVTAGDILSVEKLEADAGHKVQFDKVLLIEDGENVLIGTPFLPSAMVRAEVVETYKDDKVLIFKKKKTKQFRRTRGHRQILTKIKVERVFPDTTTASPEELRVEPPAPRPAAAAPKKVHPAAPRAAKPKAAPAAKPKAAEKPAAKKKGTKPPAKAAAKAKRARKE